MSGERIDFPQKLDDAIKAFDKLKDSKNQASFLKTKFPRTELWRFFIEIPRQNEGMARLNPLFEILDENGRKLLLELLEQPVEFHLKNIEEGPVDDKSLEGFLADIAVESMHFLCVDEDLERKHTFTKGSLYNTLLHRIGWLPFEVTEPGCVKAFIDELVQLEDKSKDIKKEESLASFVDRNISLIKSFHANVSKGVKGLHSTDAGEFRNTKGATYPVNEGINFSENGIKEILTAMFSITERFPEFRAGFQVPETEGEDAYYWSRITPTEDRTISDILNEIVQYLLTEYYNQMKQVTTAFQKLENIILLIKNLEQVHLFDDANCRTICLLYFNHLLLENGFPLVILEDPNKFDGHTVPELINESIIGMETFLEVSNGKMDLGGITTEEIVKNLRGDDLTLAYQLGFAVKPESVQDEKAYRAAVLHLKKYIELNDWKQKNENDIEIEFENESDKIKKKIPQKVYQQWEIIDNFLKTSSSHSSWKNIYEKVRSTNHNQDEVKSQHKFFDKNSADPEIEEFLKKLTITQPNELIEKLPVTFITPKKDFG